MVFSLTVCFLICKGFVVQNRLYTGSFQKKPYPSLFIDPDGIYLWGVDGKRFICTWPNLLELGASKVKQPKYLLLRF